MNFTDRTLTIKTTNRITGEQVIVSLKEGEIYIAENDEVYTNEGGRLITGIITKKVKHATIMGFSPIGSIYDYTREDV